MTTEIMGADNSGHGPRGKAVIGFSKTQVQPIQELRKPSR